MAFSLRQVPHDFVNIAPTVVRNSMRLAATPQEIFEELSGDPANWATWFPGFRTGAYDSPQPHGVGSKRRVEVLGAGTYRETIVVWDEPHRWAWRVDSTTLPLANALVEEWTLKPDAGGTLVTWTFAVDPKPPFAIGLRFAPGTLRLVFHRAMRRLERRISRQR